MPIRLPETSSIYRSARTLLRSLQELKRARCICTVQSAVIQSLDFRPFLEYTFRLFFWANNPSHQPRSIDNASLSGEAHANKKAPRVRLNTFICHFDNREHARTRTLMHRIREKEKKMYPKITLRPHSHSRCLSLSDVRHIAAPSSTNKNKALVDYI